MLLLVGFCIVSIYFRFYRVLFRMLGRLLLVFGMLIFCVWKKCG